MDKKQVLIIIGKVVLFILLLFFIEYILYCIIYYFDYWILFKMLNYHSFFLLRSLSIIFLFGLHIIILQLISLSIIFLIGGLNKIFICYDNFIVWMKRLINRLKQIKLRCEKRNFYENSHIKYLRKFNNIYKSLKAKGISFEFDKIKFGDLLELTIVLFEQIQRNNLNVDEYNESLTKILNNINQLIEIFKKYTTLNNYQIFFSFKYKEFLTFLSLELLELFNPRKTIFKTIEKDFEIFIIQPNEEQSNENEKHLVIFCGQNALCKDLYALYQDNIIYYIKNPNTTILLWDYKGYGRRKGFPTFNNIHIDVIKLANYIKLNYPNYKYIIHGISIGGFSSVKLKKELNNDNCILIADRTFSDIDLIIQFGINYHLKYLYNFIFPKRFYHSSNVNDYISIKGNNKIIFYDKFDNIINYNASLFMGIKNQYYKDILYEKIINIFPQSKLINNCFNISKIIINSEENLNDIINELLNFSPNYLINNHQLWNYNFFEEIKEDYINIDDFILDVLILGYPLNSNREINYENENNIFSIYEKIPFYIKELNNNINSNKIKFFFTQILLCFIKLNLNTDVSDDNIYSFEFNQNNQFSVKPKIKQSLFDYFGRVHRIYCGHNGVITPKDEEYLTNYLKIQNII